eukprot:scaffold169276_cov23-Tisochrysis_lutea.AAC.1
MLIFSVSSQIQQLSLRVAHLSLEAAGITTCCVHPSAVAWPSGLGDESRERKRERKKGRGTGGRRGSASSSVPLVL